MNIYKFKHTSTTTGGSRTTLTNQFRTLLKEPYIDYSAHKAAQQIAVKMASLTKNSIGDCGVVTLSNVVYAVFTPGKDYWNNPCRIQYGLYPIDYKEFIKPARTSIQVQNDTLILDLLYFRNPTNFAVEDLQKAFVTRFGKQIKKLQIIHSLNRFRQSGYTDYNEKKETWLYKGHRKIVV